MNTALNASRMMAGRTPAVLLYGPVALRAFALRSWLGHFGFRRFLLFGAYGVEAFPQRVHQVDDSGWCLDRRRDDLFPGDLGFDDALQPFAIFVLVVGDAAPARGAGGSMVACGR